MNNLNNISSLSCSKCKIVKSNECFTIRKNTKRGYCSLCKECVKKYKDQYNEENKDKIILRRKEYYKSNKAKLDLERKEYYKNNKDKSQIANKKYYSKNKTILLKKKKEKYLNDSKIRERASKYAVNYFKLNKKDQIIKRNNRSKLRAKTDPLYKLQFSIRNRIRQSLKKLDIKKSTKTENILGCTFKEFKNHLEKQFDSKMNWSNQGKYWHLDHIIPISLAKTEEELIKLNHYTNFQPLFWLDNIKKSNKIIYGS